jgi:hypothetical protein
MHGLADLQMQPGRGRRQMGDLGFFRIGVACVHDWDGITGCRREQAAIGGLAARSGVEHGAIEHDATRLAQSDDKGSAFFQICVFAKQTIGREGGS